MTSTSPPVLGVAAVLLLSACGAPAGPSGVAAATTRIPAATPSSRAEAFNPALAAALSPDEVSSSGGFTQTSDRLLGGTPDTDSRLFTSADGGLQVEVDVAVDTGAAAASADYAAYQAAAAAQVRDTTSRSTTSLGQASDEYLGSNAAGKTVCSLSFVDGRYLAVVTVIANGSATMSTVQSMAESIARTEDTKVNSIGS